MRLRCLAPTLLNDGEIWSLRRGRLFHPQLSVPRNVHGLCLANLAPVARPADSVGKGHPEAILGVFMRMPNVPGAQVLIPCTGANE